MQNSSTVITIVAIEEAINVLRNREGIELGCLGKKARCLADVYGLMIFNKSVEVQVGNLSREQVMIYFEARSILSPC